MKKSFFVIVSAMLASSLNFSLSGQSVTYALPQTSLTLEVEAVRETFYAGPYAKYAQKYLGVDARQRDETTYQITSIKIKPYVEADPQARRMLSVPKGRSADALLKLGAQGLVSTSEGSFGDEGVWRFAPRTASDFALKGVGSNLMTESVTLYQNVGDDSAPARNPIQQNMLVAKPTEQKAAETAEMIFKLRRTRVQIVTGDTDATYSGEAMASALSELTRLEQEYMTLFTGYSDRESQTQTQRFDIIPKVGENASVAFRLSDSEGIVPADHMGGKPYLLQIEPQTIPGQIPPKNLQDYIVYRVPAISVVKITDGVNVLLQTRLPIYQLGSEQYYPIK